MKPTSVETAVDLRPPAGDDALASPVERRIEPVKSRLKLVDLVRDMPVVRVLAARDFKVKYKQSFLGPLWLIFQPIALLAAFLVAFVGSRTSRRRVSPMSSSPSSGSPSGRSSRRR